MYSYQRKSRVSLIPLIQVVSLVLVFALPAVWGARVYASSPAHFDRVVVHQGDTVWSIVAHRTAAGGDLAEATYNVEAANHLKPGTELRPGQVLLIPR